MNPDKHTIAEHFIEVGNGHTLYVQDWGNKKAKLPILFLHGGPGGGVADRHKQRFVADKQRVIFFDQRGAGKSVPKGSLKHNTTEELVEDIEKIAKELKLKKFVITGGSWGSCLALAYGVKYPKRVHSMVLSGIYTGTASENDHLLNGGWKTFFPDAWKTYLENTPATHQKVPGNYHLTHALGNNTEKAKRSAYVITQVEGSLVSLDDRYTPPIYDEFEPEGMRIELHYLANNCFLPEGYIVASAKKLKMPIWLVQGRYDMICPPITAYGLNQKLPDGQLVWTTAGHGNDRPNYDVVRTLLLQLAT